MKHTFTSLLFTCLFLNLLTSCKEDDNNSFHVNFNQFNSIETNYPFENLQPKENVNYFELIFSFDTNEEVVLSSGQKCSNATNQQTCEADFASTISMGEGFAISCLPDYCFHYLKYQRTDEIGIATTVNELRSFLGEIDNASEALLLVFAEGYHFAANNKERGAIKEASGNYQIVATRMVADCSPIVINRYLLEVNQAGELKILMEEEYTTSEACI